MGINRNKSLPTTAAELRRRAEERLQAKTVAQRSPRSAEAMQRLVHELEVHRIELEMQNEALHQARDEVDSVLAKYTDLYDFAPAGYFTLNRNETISAVNLSGAELLGIERSELVGRHFGEFVAPVDRPGFTAFLGTVFTSQRKVTCEAALHNRGDLPLIVHIEALADTSGQNCRLVLIDITGRKRAEEIIEKLNADLTARAAERENANQELEAFNYTIAHDLRNPLNTISSCCQAIRELCGDRLDEQCSGYLRDAYEGTLRMNRLIEALLNFSRMGQVEPRREMVDLSALAHEVITLLKMSEPGRQVDFLSTGGIIVNGDASLLRTVLENLLGNAWKFTGSREGAVIEFCVTESAGKSVYCVRDNGSGFNMADVNRLFVPFQRLPGAEECRGFGIGLATVERIIRRHGGRVWAEGEPGKGAAFFFTLAAPGISG